MIVGEDFLARRTGTALALSALAFLALGACDGTAPEEQPAATNTRAEGLTHETVGTLNADGTETVREHDLTAAENAKEEADQALFLQGKLTGEPGAAPAK